MAGFVLPTAYFYESTFLYWRRFEETLTLMCSVGYLVQYEKKPNDDIIWWFGESVSQLACCLWRNAEPLLQHIYYISVDLIRHEWVPVCEGWWNNRWNCTRSDMFNISRFFLLCCFLAGWTGLPIKVVFLLCRCFFILQQKGGAVLSSAVQKYMFAADQSLDMEQNREECEQQGNQTSLLWFQAQFVLFDCFCLSPLAFNWQCLSVYLTNYLHKPQISIVLRLVLLQ